jgi:hypothetical protein
MIKPAGCVAPAIPWERREALFRVRRENQWRFLIPHDVDPVPDYCRDKTRVALGGRIRLN